MLSTSKFSGNASSLVTPKFARLAHIRCSHQSDSELSKKSNTERCVAAQGVGSIAFAMQMRSKSFDATEQWRARRVMLGGDLLREVRISDRKAATPAPWNITFWTEHIARLGGVAQA